MRTVRFPSKVLVMLVVALAAAAPARAQLTLPTKNDPRVGLRAGTLVRRPGDTTHYIVGAKAAEAAKNMVLVGHGDTPDTLARTGPNFLSFLNSDLAFRGNYVYQGNFSGFTIWDVSNPAKPAIKDVYPCSTDQGDPSIYGNLLFISAEGTRDRVSCSWERFGAGDSVSNDRARGVRIYDVSDPAHPKPVTVVQTCRGSHTHTLVPDPTDKNVVYIYVSGTSGIRSKSELPGCSDSTFDDPNASNWRIDIIRVPLNNPKDAKVVGFARIFNGLGAVTGAHCNPPGDTATGGGGRGARGAGRGGAGGRAGDTGRAGGRGGRGGGRGRGPTAPPAPGTPGTAGCHDITVYPAVGLAGGACARYGILLDISDPVHPKRLDAAADTNFNFWHSATFSNDGSKVLFSDEWGGGQQPRCREFDFLEWGGDALFDIKNRKLEQHAYYKIPDAQTNTENCVAHNGGLIPVPGRDIMVQGWYQGGVSVYDWTDTKHPFEIANFDRGPLDAKIFVLGGSWGAYYYNGYIYSSELVRGLDIFELKPSEFLSQNEIDAAKLFKQAELNPQMQPKIVWPAAFPVARSYLDQLVRDKGLAAVRTTAIATDLNNAEKATGASRKTALTKLAAALDKDAAGATDAARVRMLASSVRDLANATR